MSSTPTTVSGTTMLEPSSVNNSASSATGTGTIAASTSGTISLTTTVANTIIVVGVAIGGSQTVTGITDLHSLSWKKLAAVSNSTSVRGEVWWAAEPTAQSHTITVTLSARGNAALVSGSFSGENMTTPIDPSALAAVLGTGTGPSLTAQTVNPADMLLGFVACVAAPTLTNGSNFTSVTTVAQSTNVSAGLEYQVLTAAASGNTVGYTLSTSQAYVLISVALMSSGNNTYLIQAPSSQEFVLKNIYYGGQCAIFKWDGTNCVPIIYPGSAGSQTYGSFQVTAPGATFSSWYLIVNTSATNPIDVGYDGTRSI